MGGSSSDFWWLTQSQLDRFNYLELGYSKPVDDSTRPIIREQKCHVTEIEAFRSKYQNTNVFRSLKLSDNLSTGQEIIGPFLVDIDNESDLDASRIVAQQVLEYLIEQLNLSPISDLRIFF